jgi:hypothetical protein
MAALFSCVANPQTTARVSGQHCGGTTQTGGAPCREGTAWLCHGARSGSLTCPFGGNLVGVTLEGAHPHAGGWIHKIISVPGWEVLTRRSNEQNCVVYPSLHRFSYGTCDDHGNHEMIPVAEFAAALVVFREPLSES